MPKHGKNTSFKLDTSGGVLTDISTKLNNVDFPREVELVETTTFQAGAKTYVVGFADAKISLQGRWDATIDAHLNGLIGFETASFEYGPEGTTTGMVKYTGEAILTKYQKTSPVNGVAGFTAELQVTGQTTRSTFA